MNQMEVLETMSWAFGPFGAIAIVIALWRGDKPPPPSNSGDHLDATDGFFMNEWCDGDG